MRLNQGQGVWQSRAQQGWAFPLENPTKRQMVYGNQMPGLEEKMKHPRRSALQGANQGPCGRTVIGTYCMGQGLPSDTG